MIVKIFVENFEREMREAREMKRAMEKRGYFVYIYYNETVVDLSD